MAPGTSRNASSFRRLLNTPRRARFGKPNLLSFLKLQSKRVLFSYFPWTAGVLAGECMRMRKNGVSLSLSKAA